MLDTAFEDLLNIPAAISECLHKGLFSSCPSWRLKLANFAAQARPQLQFIVQTLAHRLHRLLNACVAIMCVVKEVTVASKRALASHTPHFPPFPPIFPHFPHFPPFSPISPPFPHFPHFSVAQKRLGDSGVGDFQGLCVMSVPQRSLCWLLCKALLSMVKSEVQNHRVQTWCH